MEILANLIYIYIFIYSVYFFTLSVINLLKYKKNPKQIGLSSTLNMPAFRNYLCMIIYSHNDREILEGIIKQIKSQDYPQERFSTYIILDNCSDKSEELFIDEKYINVFRINNQDTIGKDQAVAILLEKLSKNNTIDAYVFFDAKRFIKEDFLSQINNSLKHHPVITGSTILLGSPNSLKEKIIAAYHKYRSSFIENARSRFPLATLVDSNIFIIRKEIVENIGCVNFQNLNSELKYSLLLASIGYAAIYNNNIKTYVNQKDFSSRIPSLSNRLGLFFNCLTSLCNKNIKFFEFVLSLIQPNFILLALLYAFILKHSYKYYFFIDFKLVLAGFIFLLLSYSLSMVSSGIKFKEHIYLALWPMYSLCRIVKNFPPIRFFGHFFKKDKSSNKIEKVTVNVIVTDKTKNIPCRIELISENGLAKAKFIFKKKNFTTTNHLRMIDVIQELITKLEDYGLTMKICQCCEFFEHNFDGSTNMVRGFCNYAGGQQYPTLLWKSCDRFCMKQAKTFIEEINGKTKR